MRILWDTAREDALDVAARAAARYPDCIELRHPLLDITEGAVLRRIRFHLIGAEDGYVGSTSDPAWRWEGGLCWRCERNAAAPKLHPTRMLGHRHRWRRLTVVGSFSDARTSALETTFLQLLVNSRASVVNVATDARGLAVRPSPGYSFLYVCV